jgi:hypothetical protein
MPAALSVVRAASMAAGQFLASFGRFLARPFAWRARQLGRALGAAWLGLYGDVTGFLLSVYVVMATFVAHVAGSVLVTSRSVDEAARYGAAGFVIPALLVPAVLVVKRRDAPPEGARLRRVAGVVLSLACLAMYFAWFLRGALVFGSVLLAGLVVVGPLVRLRLSDFASSTLRAMALGTLTFERALFAVVLFGVNAWMASLKGSERSMTFVLAAPPASPWWGCGSTRVDGADVSSTA